MSDGKAKFKEGDKVEIIGYGHPAWWHKKAYREMFEQGLTGGKEKPKNLIGETDTAYFYDITPDLVGQKGVVDRVNIVQEKASYSLVLDGNRHISWFSEEQLKLQEKPI